MKSRNKVTLRKVPISVMIDILLEMEEKNIAYTDITIFTNVKNEERMDINDRMMFFVPDREEYFNEAPLEEENNNEYNSLEDPEDLI
jgi:hypothetical protein